jgi:hypothetical protein
MLAPKHFHEFAARDETFGGTSVTSRRDHVHGDPAEDRQAVAGNPRIGAARFVRGAGGAQVAVGIAGRDHRDAHVGGGGKGRAVADGLAALQLVDLQDAAFQGHDRSQPRLRQLRGAGAVKRDAGAGEIEMIVAP